MTMTTVDVEYPLVLWSDLVPVLTAPLSARYSNQRYRRFPGSLLTWTSIDTDTRWCDECAAQQHESGGSYGPRAVARHRRITDKRAVLNLCRRHASAWQERDSTERAETI